MRYPFVFELRPSWRDILPAICTSVAWAWWLGSFQPPPHLIVLVSWPDLKSLICHPLETSSQSCPLGRASSCHGRGSCASELELLLAVAASVALL
ncbi:hypothetical protein GGI35DRAFT_394919 [Trichoderma velutinum]